MYSYVPQPMGLNMAPSTMPAPRLVTTQDLGFVRHPGGEPYNRFTEQSLAQTPTIVPNHDSKSGYRSDSSRDEEVCHVSTRNRHEQPMEVFMKSLYDSTKRCHTCLPHEKREQLVLEDNDGSARGPTQSDKEPSIPPGVFRWGNPLMSIQKV